MLKKITLLITINLLISACGVKGDLTHSSGKTSKNTPTSSPSSY